jgi:hypothetical protein
MGRPSGLPKTGGRKKGVPNKATAAREAEIKQSGLTPLEFMLKVMRDEDASRKERMRAAADAAPYVHPKLSSIEGSLELNVYKHEQALDELE